MREYKETQAKEERVIRCEYCSSDIYTCDDCEKHFESGDLIYCSTDRDTKHICSSCKL